MYVWMLTTSTIFMYRRYNSQNMNMEQIKESLHHDQFKIVHTITLIGKSVHDYRKFDVFMQEGWKMFTRTFTYIPTFPPFANIASACALPIPLAAPVIIATLPSIFISAAGTCAAASLLLLLLRILMLLLLLLLLTAPTATEDTGSSVTSTTGTAATYTKITGLCCYLY